MTTGYRLDHLAFGLRRMADALPFLVGELGGRPFEGGPGPEYVGTQWSFAEGERLELIEPEDEGGFLDRFLEARGPGPHHVTFIVPDIDAACARARDAGYDVVGYNAAFAGWKEAFLHPKQAQGIVVQLAEQHLGLEGTWTADWDYPPHPEPASPPVRVLGPRLTVHDLARARRQWGDLLGGECTEADGGLVFEWSESPLRIAVSRNADRGEGPLAVELRSERSLALPDGPHDVLGVPFVHVA